jgi:hypothetical protein
MPVSSRYLARAFVGRKISDVGDRGTTVTGVNGRSFLGGKVLMLLGYGRFLAL